MRRQWLLTFSVLGVIAGGCASLPRSPETVPAPEGTVPLAASGSGATVVITGSLSREDFALKSVRVVGSRLASRSSDPDQFRAQLLDVTGREIETVRMWSPLLSLEWNREGTQESAHILTRRDVEISVPASIGMQAVILSWPGDNALARVNVSRQVAKFCLQKPGNPACSTITRKNR